MKEWNPDTFAWDELNGSATGGGVSSEMGAHTGNATAPSVAVDPITGNCVVARQQATGGGASQIYALMWNESGGTWQQMGASASGVGISNTGTATLPKVVANPGTGRYAIAWQDNPVGGDSEIFMREWTGAVWNTVNDMTHGPYLVTNSAGGGGISANATASTVPALTVDPETGNYMVAWQDVNTTANEGGSSSWATRGGDWKELTTRRSPLRQAPAGSREAASDRRKSIRLRAWGRALRIRRRKRGPTTLRYPARAI